LERQFSLGQFLPLRDWLREKIHTKGQRYAAAELVKNITGKPLDHKPLVEYLRNKLGPLYGII
jgi:carboxypeptidase Taq